MMCRNGPSFCRYVPASVATSPITCANAFLPARKNFASTIRASDGTAKSARGLCCPNDFSHSSSSRSGSTGARTVHNKLCTWYSFSMSHRATAELAVRGPSSHVQWRSPCPKPPSSAPTCSTVTDPGRIVAALFSKKYKATRWAAARVIPSSPLNCPINAQAASRSASDTCEPMRSASAARRSGDIDPRGWPTVSDAPMERESFQLGGSPGAGCLASIPLNHSAGFAAMPSGSEAMPNATPSNAIPSTSNASGLPGTKNDRRVSHSMESMNACWSRGIALHAYPSTATCFDSLPAPVVAAAASPSRSRSSPELTDPSPIHCANARACSGCAMSSLDATINASFNSMSGCFTRTTWFDQWVPASNPGPSSALREVPQASELSAPSNE